MTRKQIDIERESYAPPDWLDQSLRQAALSPRVRKRALIAAEAANVLVRMRKQRARGGFVTMAFPDFVRALAELARVPLDPVLSWLGVTELSPATPSYSRAVAKLAPRIGFSLRETIATVQWGLAEASGQVAAVAHLTMRRRKKPDDLEACEAALVSARRALSPADRERWDRLELEIRAAYRE